MSGHGRAPSRRRGVSATARILARMRRRTALLSLTLAALALIGAVGSGYSADRDDARILQGSPFTLDPAAAGDAGSSAMIAQLYETLTMFDDDLVIQPALAAAWELSDDGRRLVLTLRDGLTFSDGTPLRASDAVRSWLRVIDPAASVAARDADARRSGRRRLPGGPGERRRRRPARPTMAPAR